MAEMSKSQILNKLKTRSKGGWANVRKSVEPKARGAGGLPPNLKNAVAVLKSYKLATTTRGDPFFSLTGIIKEPEELEGRRVTFQWFMNESEFNTYEEAEAALANDIGLLIPNQEIPEEYEDILATFKELCERGVHVLFNTGRERTKGRMPNNYLQGLADGWADEPQEGAGEDLGNSRPGPADAAQGAQNKWAGNGNTQEQNNDQSPESDPEPEPEPEAGGDAEPYIPKIGDPYLYTYKGEKSKYKVIAVHADKDKVDLKQVKAAKGKQPLIFKNVPYSKLEPEPE